MSRRDWRRAAAAYGVEIPEAELERVTAPLDTLEAAFRPLAGSIPQEIEPAVVFHLLEEPE